MTSIENKIREYGQKRDQVALEKYVEKLDVTELTNLVHNRLNNPNFSHVWDYLMKAFGDSGESHKKRFRVAFALLQELEKGVLLSTQSSALITRLCVELPKFRPSHLIELCNFCMECIQKGNVTEMCWKEILPELLNVIMEIERLEYNETEMTGVEYKTQFINSLCMLVWSPSIVTSLTSMFIEMPLIKEEHLQVVNKLGQYMEKLTCQEIPAFVYQLLKLCRYQNSRSIFLRLQYYFGTRVYSRALLNTDNNSDSMDVIEEVTDQQAIETESTVLFHIYQCASVGHESIKDYLFSLKVTVKSPEFVLHPFQLTVLLTISTVSAFQERVMEILRTCISRAVQEEHKKVEACWLREMVPNTCKIEDIIIQIVDYCSIADRHLVVQGLVELAYILLGLSTLLNRDHLIAERQWHLGKMILLKIIKKKRQIAPCIITSLSNRIVTGQNVFQYIDCIRILSHKMSLIMLENQSCVIELLEYLIQVPGPVANQLFDAILPLTKMSPTIRDHLILLLRKALYSRVTDIRRMAVSGFLKLIKSLKISNLAALSQSSSSGSSGHSLLTQVSLNCTGKAASSAFNNEALCLEVLGILRRCFMQQAEVKAHLYDGLYDAVCMNPELGIPVLDMLWIHFSELYVVDEDSLPPLNFTKITVTKDLDVQLQEPLGKQIYAIGLITTKIQEEEADNPTVIKFKNALESICKRMINCELIHFELDDGTDLLDIVPEAQQKLLVLKEALAVYEALIGYKVCSWGPQSENVGQQINSLFQSYCRLTDFSKNLIKPKKAGKKMKMVDGNKTSQSSQSSTKTDGSQKSKPFMLPRTVMDFQNIGKILHLLHDTKVNWATTDQTNIIRKRKDFHRHMMNVAVQLLQNLNRKSAQLSYTKMYYDYITEIAGILYERCIKRLNEFIDFDCPTAILALDCFHMILTIVSFHYRSNLSSFLNVVAGKSKDEELVTSLTIFVETYEKLLESEENDLSADPEVKKLHLLVVKTLLLLVSYIPTTTNTLSAQVLEWLKNYLNRSSTVNKQVLSTFINLTFYCHMKFKTSTSLFETFALRLNEVLGSINEEKPNVDGPQLIDSFTAPTIFPLLCNFIRVMLNDIYWIILRLHSEYGMIKYPGEDNPERRREYLKSKERGICCQLCSIITILGAMCNTSVPTGSLSEALLNNIAQLYNSLNLLTRYFISRSSKLNLVFQGARFERVVKLAGKQLSTLVYDFIVYIEESQKQETQGTQSKKKSVDATTLKSKVLRDTRRIPKAIYEIEQFSKSVIQLSNKTKVDLAKFIGQGTARDFRIKGLKEVLEKIGNETTTMNESSEGNDVSGELDSNMEVDDTSTNKDNSSDEESPPHKKAKK